MTDIMIERMARVSGDMKRVARNMITDAEGRQNRRGVAVAGSVSDLIVEWASMIDAALADDAA